MVAKKKAAKKKKSAKKAPRKAEFLAILKTAKKATRKQKTVAPEQLQTV